MLIDSNMLHVAAASLGAVLTSDLALRSIPLTATSHPARALVSQGCARVDGVVSPAFAARVKQHILDHAAAPPDELGSDPRHVPGTRIRFREAINVQLGRDRSDVLLPTEDPLVAETLRQVLGVLHTTLQAGALRLPRLGPTSATTTAATSAVAETSGATFAAAAAALADAGDLDYAGDELELELVECACLINRPGSSHQELHADYRRDRPASMTPRIVAFLYLQDTPTVEHGATIFLPGTAGSVAHGDFYGRGDDDDDDAGGGGGEATHDGQRRSGHAQAVGAAGSASAPRCATLRAGDVALYDASLLHFGAANVVPGNVRAVMYMSIARAGETAVLAASQRVAAPKGLVAVAAPRVRQICRAPWSR